MIFDTLEILAPSSITFVATTPGAVELPVGAVPINGIPLQNGAGNSWFQPGDNIRLQSIGCRLPFGFGGGSGNFTVGVQWVDSLFNFFPIPELGPGSLIYLPSICDPLVFPGEGLFIKIPTVTPNRLQLRITVNALNISMVNLPAILNGVTVGVYYDLGVVHTLPLLAVP